MAGFDGALALVLVEDSTTPGTWVPVAAQTSFEMETTREMLDGAVKGTKHADSAYGRMEGTASMEALIALGDETQQALQDAMDNREIIMLRYGIDSDDSNDGVYEHEYEAPALIASISRSFPDNENSSFSVEFTINNPGWTEVVAGP